MKYVCDSDFFGTLWDIVKSRCSFLLLYFQISLYIVRLCYSNIRIRKGFLGIEVEIRKRGKENKGRVKPEKGNGLRQN
jgi:hypothetical protein